MLAAICVIAALQATLAVDCIDGWQRGDGDGSDEQQVGGGLMSKEACANLVETLCPDANGATNHAIGSCFCEFGMNSLTNNNDGSETCLFSGEWKKEGLSRIGTGTIVLIILLSVACCGCTCWVCLYREMLRLQFEEAYDEIRRGNFGFWLPSGRSGRAKAQGQHKVHEALIVGQVQRHFMDTPEYWNNQDLKQPFDARVVPPKETQDVLQKLLNRTFKDVKTRDREGRCPTGLRLMECTQVENRDLWVRYNVAKAKIMKKRPEGCTPVGGPPLAKELAKLHRKPSSSSVSSRDEKERQILPSKKGSSHSGSTEHFMESSAASAIGPVKTLQFLPPKFRKRLDKSVNEHYLWHGTTPEGAFGILDNGFKTSLAGSHKGTMFGRGCYFAECSSKSDEYSSHGQGTWSDVYALLLCRVVGGEFCRLTKSDHSKVTKVLGSGEYDSILGDREVSAGTYREFVVFEEDLIYPEYIILYKRRFNTE